MKQDGVDVAALLAASGPVAMAALRFKEARTAGRIGLPWWVDWDTDVVCCCGCSGSEPRGRQDGRLVPTVAECDAIEHDESCTALPLDRTLEALEKVLRGKYAK